MLVIYAVCHLLGMTSAVVNPFLYGWFNDNFRNEFKSILAGPIAYFFCARWSTWIVHRLGIFRTGSSSPLPAEGTEMMEQKRESLDNTGGHVKRKRETTI